MELLIYVANTLYLVAYAVQLGRLYWERLGMVEDDAGVIEEMTPLA